MQPRQVTFSREELEQLARDGAPALEASLHNRAAQANGRIAAIIAKADRENRDATPEEQRQSDQLFAQRTDAQQKIDALNDESVQTNVPSAGRTVPPEPIGNGSQLSRSGAFSGKPLWNRMFPQQARRDNVFSDLGDFARAVYRNDPRLFTNSAAGLSEGVGADGGYFVPPEFLAGFMDAALQLETVRPLATVIPTNSQSLDIPLFDSSDRSTQIAGLKGSLTAEGAAGAVQKAKTTTVTMVPKKYTVLVPSTTELLDDGGSVFTQMLQKFMSEAMAATLDYSFLQGGGAAEPLGIINAPCTISVAKETSQPTATVVPANLSKMIARLSPGSFSKSTWLCNSSVLAQLFTMTAIVSNRANTENVGGSSVDWFTVDGNGQMSLFSRPLIVTDRCAALGTVGDIILGDISAYAIALRQDVTFAMSPHVGFTTSEIYFRLSMRVDGQPLLKTPITPRGGGTTVSPFVTLASRP